MVFEFGCNFFRNNVWSLAKLFCKRKNIDTIFSEFRFWGRGNFPGKFDMIERCNGLGNDGLYSIHAPHYSEKIQKITKKHKNPIK